MFSLSGSEILPDVDHTDFEGGIQQLAQQRAVKQCLAHSPLVHMAKS